MVTVLRLALNDFKNIVRDKLLISLAILYPVILIMFSQILVQFVAPSLKGTIPLAGNFTVFFLLFVTIIPILYGFIASFLILDEKDEHLLTVLRVMPISRNTYLVYRMLFLTFFSFLVLFIFPPLSGLIGNTQFTYVHYIPIAVLFSLLTPFSAMLVSSFATNKVQAFAIFKISATIYMLPLFTFLISDNLKYIFSPAPNFWGFIALKEVLATGSNDYLHLAIGFIYTIILIITLFYIFNKKN